MSAQNIKEHFVNAKEILVFSSKMFLKCLWPGEGLGGGIKGWLEDGS
jgi:hypothetical protein